MSVLAELNARYTRTAFRLEVLQHYAGDDERRLPSIHNEPYLRRVAEHTLAGKHRDRVHVVSRPHSPYISCELDAYRANVAVGEVVLIAPADERTACLGPDFWLFDEATDHAEAVVMHYDTDGAITEVEHVIDPDRVDGMREQARSARAAALDLSEYLATCIAGERTLAL